MTKKLIIIGIESSCDDSGIGIIDSSKKILANILISQKNQHEAFCGVVPEIAARAHMQNLQKSVTSALKEANLTINDIDAIAATSGPGLIGGVIVGCMLGKSLASVLKKPFIAVNHLEGHALTARLTHNIDYPYLLLLASGGHCQFIEVKALGTYKILGQTLDDAAGEAFDKVAKMLGLGFPGGPEVEQLASKGDASRFNFPKPIINQPNCDLSFSGLKTAVRLLISSFSDQLTLKDKQDICASFQRVVGEVLAVKLQKAINIYELSNKGKTIVLAGGVAANFYLREILSEVAAKNNFAFIAPPLNLCTDNGVMIAYAGLERLQNNLVNGLDFSPRARWSLEDL